MNIGQRIKKIRKEKNITQDELANKLFVADKTISSWENNRTEPNLDMIMKISEILECSVGYLVYGDNKKNDIETEIKIKLNENEYKELEKLMNKKSKKINKVNQLDTYYQPSHRKFLNDNDITEWLRIGIRGNKKILNYKHWYNHIYCDEYEVEIDNEENLDKIFKILGLEQIVIVDKTRITYMYLDKYEVALDYVDKLGYYVEIEVKKYDKTPLEEYDELLKIAKELNINLKNIDKYGYPYHLIYNKNTNI